MILESDLQVGDWLVQPELNRIAGHGGEVQVEPKVMAVLLRLAKRPGAVVSREELLATVWSDTVVVETAVFRAISELRRIFEDDPKQPRVIDTVRKRGYRLIAPVARVGEATFSDGELAADTLSTPPPAHVDRRRLTRWALVPMLAVILAVFSAWQFRAVQVPATAPSPSWPAPPTVITSSPDLEFAPTLSPDGRGVAFVRSKTESRRADLWKIYIKLSGDTEPRILNPDPMSECSPAWSPDGRSIAFWRRTNQRDELAIAPVLGGPPQILAWARSGSGRDASWSPDGRWIAASGRGTAGEPRVIMLAAVAQETEVRRLTEPPEGWFGDISPAISPDGRSIVFVRSSVGGREQDIYLIATSGGEPRRLTFDRKPIRGIAWRGDGEHLIFSSKRSHQYALWQVSISTGALTWLGITDARSPSFARPLDTRSPESRSPDQQAGDLLVYQHDLLVYQHTESEMNIWEADLETEAPHSATPGPRTLIRSTRTDRAPHHRPDGGAIAFSSDRTGHFEIWTSDRRGTNPQRLTDFRQFATRPRWSPDGHRLAFQADIDGNHDIFVIDGPSQSPRRLTRAAATDAAPSWSLDGHWIFFASIRTGTWQVWKTASGGGEPVQITHDGGYTAHVASDGWLYFTRTSVSGLWRKSIADGSEELVLSRFHHRTLNGWTVLGDEIYYTRPDSEGDALVAFDPETSAQRILAQVPAVGGVELSISPDLKSVLYTEIDRRASDIYQVRLPTLASPR